MIPGNFNDQHVPGLDGIATTPTRVLDLCLTQEYIGSDDEPIRPGQRVLHLARGPGIVESLGNLVTQKAYINFDSGTSFYVPCSSLTHVT